MGSHGAFRLLTQLGLRPCRLGPLPVRHRAMVGCLGLRGVHHETARNFISLIGGTAAAWPLAAHAQQRGKLSRIGYLGISSPSLEPHYVEAFRQKLRELGHVDGESIAIEYRWAEGQDSRLPKLAAELVRLKPDVISNDGHAWHPCGHTGNQNDPHRYGVICRSCRFRTCLEPCAAEWQRHGIYDPGARVGRKTAGASFANNPGAFTPRGSLES